MIGLDISLLYWSFMDSSLNNVRFLWGTEVNRSRNNTFRLFRKGLISNFSVIRPIHSTLTSSSTFFITFMEELPSIKVVSTHKTLLLSTNLTPSTLSHPQDSFFQEVSFGMTAFICQLQCITILH